MGRCREYSDEQIIDAGLLIESEGQSVNPFAIRNRLSGGSSSVIKRVWMEFRKKRDIESNLPCEDITIELPSELQSALDKNITTASNQLSKLAHNSYDIAINIAEKRVTTTINEYLAKIREYEESENQASLSIEMADKQIVELDEALEEFKFKNQDISSDNAKLNGQIETMRERLEILENKEYEYNQLQREFGKLEGKLEALDSKK